MIPLWANAASGIRVSRLTTPEEVDSLVRLFEGVADEKGWRPNGALRQSLDRSVYFNLEVHGQLAGGLQLVMPDRAGNLPCHAVWPEASKRANGKCAHVAIMALDEAFRGQAKLFWHIAAEMWRHCVGMGITTLFIETSPRILPIYRRIGWPLKLRGDARVHWGSDTFLCSLGIPEVAEALLRRADRSEYYRRIVAQAFRVSITARSSSTASTGEHRNQACACC